MSVLYSKHQQPYQAVPETYGFPDSVSWRSLTSPTLLLELGAAVLSREGGAIAVAARDPHSHDLAQYVKQEFGSTTTIYRMSDEQYHSALRAGVVDLRAEIVRLAEGDMDNGIRIPRMVTLLAQLAIQTDVSDIHIEPRRHDTLIRFRMDGVLREIASLPQSLHAPLVARIKILADLRTDETRRPQDGRFEPEGCTSVSFRVSVMPTLYAEKVVMRLLNETRAVLALEELGFSEEQRHTIVRNMEKPYGMVIASGPTGSGKTTTLYALMGLLNTADINVATLEDPVESALDGVNQTQVNPDTHFTFANGLRSLLRQDPDVILVGEIRDEETINMAAHASMTGHLVLTSIHTNDAVGVFTRFAEMGVDDFLSASVVNLVVGQRLVRLLCPACAYKRTLDAVLLEKVRERKDVCEAIRVVDPGMYKNLARAEFWAAEGCEACVRTGYVGRRGVYELLEVNKEIHDLVLGRRSADEIHAAAIRAGMHTMVEDGVRKVLAGVTTFEEVLRVTRTN